MANPRDSVSALRISNPADAKTQNSEAIAAWDSLLRQVIDACANADRIYREWMALDEALEEPGKPKAPPLPACLEFYAPGALIEVRADGVKMSEQRSQDYWRLNSADQVRAYYRGGEGEAAALDALNAWQAECQSVKLASANSPAQIAYQAGKAAADALDAEFNQTNDKALGLLRRLLSTPAPTASAVLDKICLSTSYQFEGLDLNRGTFWYGVIDEGRAFAAAADGPKDPAATAEPRWDYWGPQS